MTELAPEAPAFEVWPENWDTVVFFLRLQTQWRVVTGMSGAVWQGLDYAGVQAALGLCRVADPETVFAGLSVMERAALPLINRRLNKA